MLSFFMSKSVYSEVCPMPLPFSGQGGGHFVFCCANLPRMIAMLALSSVGDGKWEVMGGGQGHCST